MNLFKKKKLVFVLVLLIIIVASAFIAFFVLSSKEDPKPEESSEKVEESEKPTISAKVLAAEKLPQYEDKSTEYGVNDIQGTPDKSMFADIENPTFLAVSKENKIKGSDTVASFHVGEDYRAYPLKYINYHHIVNDKFDKTPVLISYCGICNSAAAYSPIVKGKTLTFGVLGVLLHNDLVMYDKQTDSWWIQITGEAFTGKYKDTKLTLLPGMELVTYADFKKAHSNGKVLQPVAQYTNLYEQFDPAQFYEGEPEEGGSESVNRDQVVGIEVRGKAKAYKIDDVKKENIINDKLNGWSLLIISDPKDGGVRIFRRFLVEDEMILEFELKNGNLVDKETGSTWNFLGEATAGELKGKTLTQPKYLELFQFAWEGFFPKTAIYKP